LRFANNNLGIEVWLSIEAGFRLDPPPDLPSGLTSRQHDLLLLESTCGFEVQAVRCRIDGHLEILFTNGKTFTVDIGASADEHWELREEGGTALLVASQNGGYAIWQRTSASSKRI
jgi:hypothetical protein